MDARIPPRALVLDDEELHGLPTSAEGVSRVVCTFEASADFTAALGRQLPGIDIAIASPRRDGPWREAVERDLEELADADVRSHGVPLLECFRSVWREQLSAMRALELGLAGERRLLVTHGKASVELLLGAREGGDLDGVETLPARSGARRMGLLGKLRRAGPRGIAMALSSRLDPSGDRRAGTRRRPRVRDARSILVSSYVNPTRAALEAWAATGGGPALLLCTGPGADRGLDLPPDVTPLTLSSALALDRAGARALRASVIPAALAGLERWNEHSQGWKRWSAIQATAFGRAVHTVHLPEAISIVVAVRALAAASGARTLIVGDEFSFGDRAALFAARHLSIETVSRQHGVLDSHYLDDPILADRYLAWNQASVGWLREHGAVGCASIEVLPRPTTNLPRRSARPGTVVVFLQPTDLVRVPFDRWLAETLPSVLSAAASLGLRTVLKPHPLQSRTDVLEAVPSGMHGRFDLVTDLPAATLLADAAAAVLLDSSVCLDAMDAGVPCLSTAWYRTPYGTDLARLGYVSPCASPAELETALRTRVRRAEPA